MRRAVFFAFFLATTAQAANLVVTSEAPLSVPSISSASGAQTSPSMAWYGNSLATTWIDVRNYASVRVAQLDSLGHPKEIAARLAGSVYKARIAANGQGTPLIAMQGYGGPLFVGPVGTSGQYIPGDLDNLITNGATYLAETSDTANIYGTILDTAGETLATAHLQSPGGYGSAAFAIGGDYHVIRVGQICGVYCDGAIQDAVIHSDGTFEDHTLIPHTFGNTPIAAATTGREILIAWFGNGGIELLELTPSLSLIARSHIAAAAEGLFLTSDGSDFLIAWSSNHSLHAASIGASGLTVGSAFALEPYGFGSTFTSARTSDGMVIGWSDEYNVYTRGAANVAALATAPTTLASLGIIPQQDVSVHDVPVWIEGEFRSLVVSPHGTIAVAAPDHTLYTPVAATGAGSTIVVWRDTDNSGETRIMARINDDASFVIGEGGNPTSADVIFDGTTFIVAWTNGHVYETRLLPSGQRLETTEIASSGNARAVKAARSGDSIAITFVDGADTIMHSQDGHTRPVTTNGGALAQPAIALNDRGEPAITWIEQKDDKTCVALAHQLAGGPFIEQSLYCSVMPTGSPAIAWSGSEFVIAWDELAPQSYRMLQVARATSQGTKLDGPFTMSLPYRESFAPSLASSPSGVVIGYQRLAGEEPYDDVSRVFTREMLRISGGRLRTAPH